MNTKEGGRRDGPRGLFSFTQYMYIISYILYTLSAKMDGQRQKRRREIGEAIWIKTVHFNHFSRRMIAPLPNLAYEGS